MLSLPDDLLLKISKHVLTIDLPSALRLLQTCASLRMRLAASGAVANARRLRWEEAGMSRHAVSADGLSLWRGVAAAELPWAAGPLLPTVGQSSWTVRVADVIRIGWLYIGVCDAASLDSWSLFLLVAALNPCETHP